MCVSAETRSSIVANRHGFMSENDVPVCLLIKKEASFQVNCAHHYLRRKSFEVASVNCSLHLFVTSPDKLCMLYVFNDLHKYTIKENV